MGVLLHAWLGALAGAAPAMATPPLAPTPCGEIVREIDDSMRKTIVQGSPGMIAAAAFDGQPVFVRTLGWANLEHRVPLRRNNVFALASVTKQFTAAAILKLMEEGRLRLDDKVSKYIPELPQAGKITIYQLLVQTSGLPDYSEDPAGSPTKSVPKTPQQMLEWIARLTPALQFEPGSKWAYSNSNYVLLGLIVERVGKRSLAQYFEETLFKPAGLTATAFDNPRDVVFFRAQGYRKSKTAPSGFTNAEWISPTIPGAAGGLRTTADDLIRWSHALFSGRILTPATVRLMTSPGRLSDGRTTKLGMPEAWQKGLNADYAMGLFLTPTPHGPKLWHKGDIDGFSTWLSHYPDQRMTLVLLENSQSAEMDNAGIAEQVFKLRDRKCAGRPELIAR